MSYMLKYIPKFLLIFYLIFFTIKIKAMELNIICTIFEKSNTNKEFKDLVVYLNSDSKEVSLGGLNFTADEFVVTDSNIKWKAMNVKDMYDDSDGGTNGTLGRFSGNLTVTFFKNDISLQSRLDLKCKDLKIKDRKF